jgi:hypothetical protein
MHTQVRRMMSEKKQRKKHVKTGEGEPEIRVTEEVEGRVAGSSKTLMDERVHALMAEEEQPPPYSKTAAAKAKTTGSFRLTGECRLRRSLTPFELGINNGQFLPSVPGNMLPVPTLCTLGSTARYV